MKNYSDPFHKMFQSNKYERVLSKNYSGEIGAQVDRIGKQIKTLIDNMISQLLNGIRKC